MIPPGSRYQDAEHNFTLAHRYNAWGYPLLEGEIEKNTLRARRVGRDTLHLMTTVEDLTIPPFEYYAKEDENMQFLAYKHLDDPKRWHEIANVNSKVWYPLDLKPGACLRIPS